MSPHLNNPYLRNRILLSIDLETTPIDSQEVRAEIEAGISPPGSMSKPETIALWEETRKPALVDEAFARGGLSPVTGKIICFGLVSDQFEQVFTSDDEKEVLRLAYEFISTLSDPITLVGHAITNFDLPYLRCRSIVHGLRPPVAVAKAWRAKPWSEEVGDTMLLWSPERDKRVSLDRLCRLLGIPSPKADGTPWNSEIDCVGCVMGKSCDSSIVSSSSSPSSPISSPSSSSPPSSSPLSSPASSSDELEDSTSCLKKK